MADVTVNIRGNADQLKRELGDVANSGNGSANRPESNQGGSGNGSIVDKMFDSIRQQFESAGRNIGSEFNDSVRQQRLKEANEEISSKYDSKRSSLREFASSEYDKVDEQIEKQKRERLSAMGEQANDPLAIQMLNRQVESDRDKLYASVGRTIDDEESKLEEQELQERNEVERELTEVMKQLTQQYERNSENQTSPDSYLGRLRAEKRELIDKRESSTTEDETLRYTEKVKEVDERIRKAEGRDKKETADGEGRTLGSIAAIGITQGMMNAINSLQQANWGGVAAGVGGAIASSFSGEWSKRAAQISGVLAAGVAVADFNSNVYESKAGLARNRAVTGGETGDYAVTRTGDLLNSIDTFGYRGTDFGLTDVDMAKRAEQRLFTSGTATNQSGQLNWYDETVKGAGLEQSLNLKEGSLMQGSQFDRYGKTVTDAVTQLVYQLEKTEGSGVSINDFTRVQEKFDIQQQVMSGQMNRTDKPDYDSANKLLLAFSSVKGISQDKRIGSDIQQMQDAIQNPMNDRMRALVFSTVSEMMPETQGRMDKVDQAIRDPKNEAKIMQAVMSKLTQQFGGFDSQMGYFALKSVFPNIAPERLKAYSEQMQDGTETSDMMKYGVTGGKQSSTEFMTEGETAELQKELLESSKQMKSTLSAFNTEVITWLQKIHNSMSATTNNTNPQKPKKI